MVNVIVGRKRNIQVTNDRTAGIVDSVNPVTILKTPAVTVGGVSRLDHLDDVEATHEVDGYVLVYNAQTDKWVATQPATTADADGGSF